MPNKERNRASRPVSQPGRVGPIIAALVCVLTVAARAEPDELQTAFVHPPRAARPLTWWHWLDGNITREGITADLEAMQQAGLGGVYLFNAGVGMPDGPVRFLQPAWLEMLEHALHEADRLGLKFGVHNCDGFSQSGGPWITPDRSMKVLTWSSADVTGPGPVTVTLPQPPSKEAFYRDIAVVAFPLPDTGPPLKVGPGMNLRGALPAALLARLTDGDPVTQAVFPATADGHQIEFGFESPRTIRSVVLRNATPHRWEEDFALHLEVSEDGTTFRETGRFTANWDFSEGGQLTAACAEATGRMFRLRFKNPWPVSVGEIELSGAARVHFAEAKAARLRSRGHGAESRHYHSYPGPDRSAPLPAQLLVSRGQVTNLSACLAPDGSLKWNAPRGVWRVLRVGFTSNGHQVAPATAEGRGLECDKLDAATVRFHLEQYVGRLMERAGPLAGRTFSAMEVDSWECGIQNWTAGLEDRFRQRVGYDLLPFLPTLLEGWIVDSRDVSERALWDWRRFLADELAENYFAEVTRFAQARGLTCVGEFTGRQQFLYDIAAARHADVPMGEFWINTGPGQGVRVDTKVAASTARTTGRRVVAAEAFTAGGEAAGWDNHPFTLKPLGDRAFCAGVNQFVFHTFAHQPYAVNGPGFTFASWGLNFNRGNTWWPEARAWVDYLARCQQLLQSGLPVADVLWWVGEDVPNRIGWREELNPPLPEGYDFDGCDAQTVLAAQVKNGRVVLPGGATYRVLLLPQGRTMRPPLARKLYELVNDGAVVLGNPPLQSPRLKDVGEGDAAVRQLAKALWGETGNAPIVPVDRRVGKGRVFANLPFAEVFARLGVPADFELRTHGPEEEVLYTHRQIAGADCYFLSNQRSNVAEFAALFRVKARAPEVWDPAGGTITRPGLFQPDGGRMRVPLRLPPFGSVFVVFREPLPGRHAVEVVQNGAGVPHSLELFRDLSGALRARGTDTKGVELALSDGTHVVARARRGGEVIAVDGPWRVRFAPGLGAPEDIEMEQLQSWTTHPDPGVRHFSGRATYSTTFQLPPGSAPAGCSTVLDLGRVEVIARVELNGVDLGVLWQPPLRVAVDQALRPGRNQLKVTVVNLWPNRMIGDAALPEDLAWQSDKPGALPSRWPEWLLTGLPRPSGRVSFCTRREVYSTDTPLRPSGLLGPVTLDRVEVVEVK